MRPIDPHEETLTAAEVAQKISYDFGIDVTSHKIGQTARLLNLDYVETDLEIRSFTVRQRKYGIKDLPAIASRLSDKKSAGIL